MSIKLIPFSQVLHDKKPREKIVEFWIDSLNDIELLSVIFWTWYKWMDVMQLAQHLLNDFGTKGLMQFDNINDLQSKAWLPLVKSCLILAIGEYFKRISMKDDVKIKSSEQLYDYIKDEFKNTSFEKLMIVCVDNQRRVLYSWPIAQWEPNSLQVSLASVFHHPIRLNIRNFYLVHNHPNWVSNASKEDINFTLEIKKECLKYWFSFDDHLIIWNDWFYSFSLNGIV